MLIPKTYISGFLPVHIYWVLRACSVHRVLSMLGLCMFRAQGLNHNHKVDLGPICVPRKNHRANY